MDSTERDEQVPEKGLEMEQKKSLEANGALGFQRSEFREIIHQWCERLRIAAKLATKKSSSKEPYKFVYEALEDIKTLRQDIQQEFEKNDGLESSFWVKFALIHCYSSIAKWNESCEQLTEAEQEHRLCIHLIDEVLESSVTTATAQMDTTLEEEFTELQYGILRVRYLLIYELTRYAILCSEQDNQEKALGLLKRAEQFYHTNCKQDTIHIAAKAWPILNDIDVLNPQKSSEMFVYVLFYLGQAYQITENKEYAILYLHMVLRKQLEMKSSTITTWASDTIKMATAVLSNVQSFQSCKTLLGAVTSLLDNASGEQKLTDEYRQSLADLGRAWMKLGVEILDASCDRLKDLEQQTRKPPKLTDTLQFTYYEKLSLEFDMGTTEFDTRLLINSLSFPTLDLTDIMKSEMPARYARDFDEARLIFLPIQRWFRIAREYYVIDSFAGDYIEIVTDYATSYKYLVFFEPRIERQITMQNRRVTLLEELLKSLNPVAYHDVFHYVLKDLADVYESIYKLKVSKARDHGEPLRPKDKKLVKLLCQAVDAHKRNLENFQIDLNNSTKNFPEAFEKSLVGLVLSVGRILGSISHEHPHHPDAIKFAQGGKAYYEYFLNYLNRHPPLKSEFKIVFDSAQEMPQLLEAQMDRIKQRLLVAP